MLTLDYFGLFGYEKNIVEEEERDILECAIARLLRYDIIGYLPGVRLRQMQKSITNLGDGSRRIPYVEHRRRAVVVHISRVRGNNHHNLFFIRGEQRLGSNLVNLIKQKAQALGYERKDLYDLVETQIVKGVFEKKRSKNASHQKLQTKS